MAELGAIAAIIGIAGAGIKLSFALFDLADRIGSAGDEVKLVATELSLFCSTLQALKGALEDTDNIHCTPAAYQLVNRIVDECRSVITELEKIVSSLAKDPGASLDFPSLEWTSRVKWTFKRSKVQVQRQTLESCKSTLHLLLSTLQWSRRTSMPRAASPESLDETEQYQMVTQGLVLAVRQACNQLRSLEAAADKEEENHGPAEKRELSRLLHNFSLHAAKPQDDRLKLRRASTWLDKLVFDEEPEEIAHPGQRQQRLSSATTAKDPFLLLQKWTENRPRRLPPVYDGGYENVFGSGNFDFAQEKANEHSETPKPLLPRVLTTTISPKSTLISPPTYSTSTLPPIREAVIELNKYDQPANQTAAEWLSAMLGNLGLANDHRVWELCVVFGGNERVLQGSEFPDDVIADLTKYNLNPRILMKQSKSLTESPRSGSP